MFRAADLPAIRRRLAEDPDAKAWWEGFRRALDANVAKGVKMPPRGAQWAHWYNCRKCGAHLSGESPSSRVGRWRTRSGDGSPVVDVYGNIMKPKSLDRLVLTEGPIYVIGSFRPLRSDTVRATKGEK